MVVMVFAVVGLDAVREPVARTEAPEDPQLVRIMARPATPTRTTVRRVTLPV
jgi:hypothetical protein